MLTRRIIPILLLKNNKLVKSLNFTFHQVIGDPYQQTKRYNDWEVDELIYLDIDLNGNSLEVLSEISKNCFMPLTFGGKIRSLQDIHDRLNLGADKITLNTQALLTPELINLAAHTFGQQAIIVGIDIYKNNDGRLEVYSHNGQNKTNRCPFEWIKEVEARGAGEILIQFIQLDGTGLGFDTHIINELVNITNVPIIACSGAGNHIDFKTILTETEVSGAAAANIFLFKELSYIDIKKSLELANVNVRPTTCT